MSQAAALFRSLFDQGLRAHPFFAAREHRDLRYVWLVMMTGRAFESSLPRYLEELKKRVVDPARRAIIADQLHDELGGGDPTKAHHLLYAKSVEALMRFANAEALQKLAPASEQVTRDMQALLEESDLERAVAGSIALELLGCHIIAFLTEVAKEHGADIGKEGLEWFVRHDDIDSQHVQDMFRLAELFDDRPQTVAVVKDVANKTLAVLWRYFDVLGTIKLPREA